MRPWRYAGPNPDGWWCVAPNCYQNANPMTTVDAELAAAHALNVADVRLEFPWPLIEPTRGGFDWTRADAIVSAARSHGVVLQPVLVYTPSWAAASATSAPAPADWSAFVTAFMQHYGSTFPVIEMWNEPDSGQAAHYWSAGDQAYVTDILIPGYAAVKAVSPGVLVEMGAPSCATCGFLDSIYQDGGANSFDIASYHDYGSDPVAAALFTHNTLLSHGQGGKPIWLGEYGVQENSVSDPQQQALVTAGLTEAGYPAMAQFYNLRDDNSMTCCPGAVAVAAYWGLLQHDDATRKTGFGVMQGLLGGSG